MMKICVAFVLGVVLQVAVSASGVPVLMWGNDGVTGRLPVPLAGHTLQSDAFKRNYLDSVMPCKGCDGHNIIVFLREKLSMEDVTQFGDVYNQNGQGGSFNNIKALMEKDDSLALASVGNIIEGLDYLKAQFGNNVHLLDSVSEVERVPFGKNSRLVLIELEEDHGLPFEKRLAANDELIGAVVKALEAKKVPYTAMFTGERSSQEEKEANTLAGASSRHLLAEAGTKAVAVNITDCFLMYYTGLAITSAEVNTSVTMGASVPIEGEPTTDGSVCTVQGASITLKYAVTGQKFTILTLKMETTPSPLQDWYIGNMTLSMDEEEMKMAAGDLGGPMGFSYACGNAVIRNIRETMEQKDLFLTFSGFQFQAFALDNGRFGYANDCTPFFTIGILSGLLVSLLLIAILAFGMMMVASITTMDRFDDPKGTPLNVNVQEK